MWERITPLRVSRPFCSVRVSYRNNKDRHASKSMRLTWPQSCLSKIWKHVSMDLSSVDSTTISKRLGRLRLESCSWFRTLLLESSLRPRKWITLIQFCQRIDFKILLLVYKALNGLYLILYYFTNHPDLRGLGSGLLSVPRVKTINMEEQRSFFMLIYLEQAPRKLSLLLTQGWRLFCLLLPFIKSFLTLHCHFYSCIL